MASHELLRITLLSPAHFGSAWGEAALDRPTQVDAWQGLPFAPASALKGVLAGRLGEVAETEDQEVSEDRESRYGSPDRGDRPGTPSSVVLGEGMPLAFPVSSWTGRRWWVVVAPTVAWALRMEGTITGHADEAELLRVAAQASPPADVIASEDLPHVRGLSRLHPIPNLSRDRVGRLLRLLRRLTGEGVPAGEPILVAGERRARELWRLATERRTLTAVDDIRKVVRTGFLRSVELVPEGAVFLSLVTRLADAGPSLGVLQVGAWESLGLGWVHLEAVPRAAPEVPAPAAVSSRSSGPPARDRILLAALRAVEVVAGDGSADVRAAARAALRSFGWRFRAQGPEAVLAFQAAKAKVRDPRPTPDARAHRWLLLALVDPEEDPSVALGNGTCPPLVRWLEARPFETPLAPHEEETLLERWLWLRRYAELLLPAPAAQEARS